MMKYRHTMPTWWIGCALLTALLAGCVDANGSRSSTSGSQTFHFDTVMAGLAPDIQKLYLSWHELNQIYKDIKSLESAFLFSPDDRQLGTIQKCALYIQGASLKIHHQWESLSVLHYIRPNLLRDYLTLSVNGLTSAIREIGYDQRFLNIYLPYITHDTVSTDLIRAQDSIEKNVALLNRILEKLEPIANVPGQPALT